DLDWIAETADSNPDISFVMIGPLAKIHQDDLPRRTNIHYLGMKSYEVLPAYLKAFSVALMPCALNDATKFLSPTKTLEYMAAGKPIISTAITDVVRDYSHCVHIVADEKQFTSALKSAIYNTDAIALNSNYEQILRKTSWDETVEKMAFLITKTVLS